MVSRGGRRPVLPLRFSIFEHADGVEVGPGNHAVYDFTEKVAHFGMASVAGPAVRWELGGDATGSKLGVGVVLDPSIEWLMRCDRVDFPPGGVAYRHTHPGPGIRYLLFGEITIASEGRSTKYGPRDAWVERGPDPVFAEASTHEPTAFVRVMLLPREWEGKRTIRYVNAEDADKPKFQKATVFFDQLIKP